MSDGVQINSGFLSLRLDEWRETRDALQSYAGVADEQMNFGFVTGDDSIAEPYFYATTYPAPDAFIDRPLPDDAYWHTAGWIGAILPYAMLTQAGNPSDVLLNFLQTTHQAGVSLMRGAHHILP